ncbi:MAG: hypothetical protein H7A35_06905 [Planctomycetales bacterium]|nr:hypothetical protein [bacterium]UNM09782.1 MAG: hypothetical protein H7A35_06905 [Planctomycetales bacterium]
MSEDNTQQEQPQEPKRAKYAPDPGFTAERDRRMIVLSCAVLVVMTLVIFLMVRHRYIQLKDVAPVNVQISMTDKQVIRDEASVVDPAAIVADPEGSLAVWTESSGSVLFVHDKKGDPINWDDPNPSLGTVYWLDCGLPVTAVKPQAPVTGVGGRIRFWGQVAATSTDKLEFSDSVASEVLPEFGIEPGQRIAIFFASEIEEEGRDTPLGEEIDPLAEISGAGSAGQGSAADTAGE